MIIWLNISSFVIGIVALILPVINMLIYKRNNYRRWFVFSIMSMIACTLCLFLQIFHNYLLVKIGDFSAIMDTIGAVTFAASSLFIVTIILNGISFMVFRSE